MKKQTKATILLVVAVLAVALIWYVLMRRKQPEIVREAYVQVDGIEILRFPLNEDARFLVADGKVLRVEDEVTLESLGEEGAASKHDINFILVKEGCVSCVESNCDNQICVYTPAITGDAYDTPIVCLPHNLFLYVTE